MRNYGRIALFGAACLAGASITSALMAHGNVTPQAVDTSALPEIGADWVQHNPYRGNATAAKIGESAYGQNCARCHGLEAISGGIAPDIRFLDEGAFGDEWFMERIRKGGRAGS